MVAFSNDFSSYAKGSLLVVVPVVVFIAVLPKILQAFASNLSANSSSSIAKSSQEHAFTFTERKINNGQSFVGTGKKVADVFHPLRQSKKSASSGPSDRSIMTRLWFRMSYKPAG